MAIETTRCVEYYPAGGGGQTVFPINFPVLQKADLEVVGRDADNNRIEYMLDIDYTVSILFDATNFPLSASVTFAAPIPAGVDLTITRSTAVTQLIDLIKTGGYFPEELERAVDKLTMICQELGVRIEVFDPDAIASLLASIMALENTKADKTDPRFTDARRPTAHAGTHAADGSDPLTPAAIGAATPAQLATGLAGKLDVAVYDVGIAGKADRQHTHSQDDVTGLREAFQGVGTALNAKAPLASPALTGEPTAPTAPAGDSSDRIATTEFVQDAVVDAGGLPPGGDAGDFLVKRADGGGWDSPQTATARLAKGTDAAPGILQPDGTTIVVSDGVITAVGGGGPGATDHRALTNRDAAGSHPQSAITDLVSDLNTIRGNVAAKADAAEVSTALAGKANATHTQAMSTITGLENALNAKANRTELNAYATQTGVDTALATKADKTELAAKANSADLGGMAFINDAPNDSNTYGRKGGAWEQIAAGGIPIGTPFLLAHRRAELPPGFWFPSGDYFELTSPIGQVLNSFSATYKSDWGIVVSGTTIRLYDPNKFFYSTYGRFFRPVNGTNRLPGSVQGDAMRDISGKFQAYSYGNGATSGAFTASISSSNTLSGGSNPSYNYNAFSFSASRSVTTDAENRPYNVGMTPAVYLGVTA